MELKLAFICVVVIATSEAFLHHFLRRDQVEAQSVQSNGEMDSESHQTMRCLVSVAEQCPQLRTPGTSLSAYPGSPGLVQNNHLSFSCSDTTIRENQECVRKAVINATCEDHQGGPNGMLLMWEYMCDHEAEFVENAACLRNPDLEEQMMLCTENLFPLQNICQVYTTCFPTAINNLYPLCTPEAAELMRGLVHGVTSAMFGKNCERAPSFF